jgi:hypothetical protein
MSPENIDVPKELVQVMEQIQVAQEGTCGGCANRDRVSNHCSEVCMKVRPADPACWAFVAKGT